MDYFFSLSAIYLLAAAVAIACVICLACSREEYKDIRSYFPWNEANLVKKSIPASTVRCDWCLRDDSFKSPWTVRKYDTVLYDD